MRLIRHSLVKRDLMALVDHIVEATQRDLDATVRRLDEIDILLAEITANPLSGVRLPTPLEGWLVRHGGRGHRITIVFRADVNRDALYVALIAFGGRDWLTQGNARKSFAG